jgi:protein TonB
MARKRKPPAAPPGATAPPGAAAPGQAAGDPLPVADGTTGLSESANQVAAQRAAEVATDVAADPASDARAALRIGPRERLAATLALSLIGFGVFILGVGFRQDDAAPVVPTLDVILTQTSTPEPPRQADFIAQANNQGGGDRDKPQRPREAQLAAVPKPEPGAAPEPLTAQAPPPAPPPRERIIATVGTSSRHVPLPEDQPPDDPTRVLPTGRDLMAQNAEMARLSAELAMKTELYARRPKKKMITASTREYEYAAYMRAWVDKVERVGNLNYPEQARRQGLSGELVLTVSIARDGTVKGVLVNSGSGRAILDNAAVRVVQLASPFAPLPRTGEDVDILEITRTWSFRNGDVSSN